MTNRSLLPVLLLSTSLAACSNNATAGSASASASARPATAASATTAAATADPPAAKAELVDFTNDLIGYTMKMPKGFDTLTSEDVVAAYSAGAIMIYAQTSPSPATTPESVIVGGLQDWMTLDKKAGNDLVLIEGMKPDDPRPVNVYAAPKGAKFYVHCTAPAEDKALAREICASIKTRK